MNRLLIYTVALFSLTLFSCSKQIEGQIVDNFGNPIKDVEISIEGSEYKTQSNSSGNYSIDYAAGEIIIKFKKEGYIGDSDVLYITEKETYPLKQVTLTKRLEKAGIYIASNEFSDYSPKLKLQTGIKAEKGQIKGAINFYLSNTDSLNVIKLSSLDDVRIYHYNMKKFLLGKVGENKKITELSPSMFYYTPKANEAIKENIKEITNSLEIHTFKPEFDTDYVYIFEEGYKSYRTPKLVTYIFRFEKK